MSQNSVIAVIDIGKTNAKVAFVDEKLLTEIAVVTQQNQVLPSPPYPHFDIDNIYQFIISSLSKYAAEFDIKAISVTTHGACCALIDGDGELVAPVMDYEFEGLESTSASYDKVRPEFRETGSPKLPVGLNLGAQIFWIFDNFSEIKTQTRQIVTYAQYWSFKLTGILKNELTSLGCHTDLWDPYNATYSSMVHKLGWLDKMAPVAKANEQLGMILPQVSLQTGLKSDMPVYCGIHDSNASLLPHLMTENAPFSVVSTGTWVIAMAIGGAQIELDPKRDTLINVNGLGEPVPSARFMGGREFETLMANRCDKFDPSDVDFILQNEVMLLPSIMQNSGPFQGQHHRWTVEPSSLTDGQYFAAVSFYLALMTASCLSLIGAKGKNIVEGPFSQNTLYCDMLATAISSHVQPSRGTGTSVGAALLTMDNFEQSTDVCLEQFEASQYLRAYAKNWIRIVTERHH
ncbi:MAG: FGGY-family carbohydrate kinase [Rhizobiaceae bacterium]|nr:FGGY-family carbohydrate kinase [Rhizobiaceae bacterium]